MNQYTEMFTDELYTCIANLEKTIKDNETHGSEITLLNAMHNHELASEELGDRILGEADQQVEDFMEHQANMRDHEYKLETMNGWPQ